MLCVRVKNIEAHDDEREQRKSKMIFIFPPAEWKKNTRRRVLFSNGERVRYESEFWNMMMIKNEKYAA